MNCRLRAQLVRRMARRGFPIGGALLLAVFAGVVHAQSEPVDDVNTLRILVMDPLAAPLSCACVPGRGQRDYNALEKAISKQLNRPVRVFFEESFNLAFDRFGRDFDVVIGKASVVQHDADQTNFPVTPLLRLTDWDGETNLHGIFLVPAKSPIQSPADLKDARIVLGPEEDQESHVAAINRLKAAQVLKTDHIRSAHSLEEAVYAVADGEADAVVISHYLPPLLEGCGKIEKGSLRVVARTAAVPFVTVFASREVAVEERSVLKAAFLKINTDQQLIKKLESKSGFVSIEAADSGDAWVAWRGPAGDGTAMSLPQQLSVKPQIIWSADVTGPALSGIAATADYVLTADKDKDLQNDVYRCFDATAGEPLWQVTVAAPTQLQYTNAPRAMPIVVDDLVYFQGALGDLTCVELVSGDVSWQRNLVKDYQTELLTWGSSSPPFIHGRLLLTNPGAEQGSVVALDRYSGEIVWETPGHAAAYSAFVSVSCGRKLQAIGYDSASLGGWEVSTGQRLWELIPPGASDFNVGTPIVWGDKVLVATENSGTRLYEFDEAGRLNLKPIAENLDAAPDTCTPVIINDRVFLTAYGQLYCLDLKNDLKTIWVQDDDLFYDHTNLIAGNDRVLIFTTTGDLLLVRSDTDSYELVSRWQPFGEESETMSHPAIIGDRLYVRNDKQLLSISLENDR